MRLTGRLRLLCFLGFLLLMAPFYETCSCKRKEAEVVVEEVSVDTTVVIEPDIDTTIVKTKVPVEIDTSINDSLARITDSIQKVEIKEIPFYQKVYEFIDDEDNYNAFELAEISINLFDSKEITFKGIVNEIIEDFRKNKKNKYEGISMIIGSLSFVFIILISILLILFSLFKKLRWVYKLSITNLILILLTLICIIFFQTTFESYKQIKWGYYAFTLVQIAIFIYSRKYLRLEKNR